MNIRTKQLICLLAVAFLCIFAKCVYGADANGITFQFVPTDANATGVTTTADNNQVTFYMEVEMPNGFSVDGLEGYFDYDSSALRIDSVNATSAAWTLGGYRADTGKVFVTPDPTKGTDSKVLTITATVLDASGSATIGLKNIAYSYMDENYDFFEIQYPAISLNITRDESIDIPDDPGYLDPVDNPTPTPVEPTPTPTPTPTTTPNVSDDTNNSNNGNNANDTNNSNNSNKTDDSTKANKKIPQTGANLVIYGVIGGALFGSALLFKKYRNK